eukprot:jgi/Phyca11/19587/fgenesh1_pg.PHYCAscaffold_50_\
MTRLMAVASFKLDIKLKGTENYEEWSMRIQTAMLTLNYNRLVLGVMNKVETKSLDDVRSTTYKSVEEVLHADVDVETRDREAQHFVRDGPQSPTKESSGISGGRRATNADSLNIMLTPRNPAALAPDVSDQGQDGGACTGGTATSGSSGGESVQVTSGTGKPLETIVAAASPQVSDGESKNASVDVSASKELCAGYDMTFSKDNKKLWLTKPKMKLEFLLVDGLYRMWTRKTTGSTAKAEDHVVLDDDEVVRRVVAGLPLEGNDGYLADISLEVEKGAIPQLDSGE